MNIHDEAIKLVNSVFLVSFLSHLSSISSWLQSVSTSQTREEDQYRSHSLSSLPSLLARSRRYIGKAIRGASVIGFSVGPLNPAIHGIRVVSVIEFSVCSLYVLCHIFLILLQYNIWLPDPKSDVFDPEFVLRVILRRHDTSTRTAMYVMLIYILGAVHILPYQW